MPTALSRKCDVVRRVCQAEFAVEQIVPQLRLTVISACDASEARAWPVGRAGPTRSKKVRRELR